MSSHLKDSKIFARDEAFWNNYLKGRPQAPRSFFDRIYDYHQQHGGNFGTAHDVGAGNGPYSAQLRERFQHVIVSDIVPENVEFAESRLGVDGFSYRAAKVEEADDILEANVDLVFATNVLHFVEPDAGLQAIARQLKSGGTFAAAGFGPALFNDPDIQDIWNRISQEGGRVLLAKAEQPELTVKVMERSQGPYNVAPLGNYFQPGANRVHLNMANGGITGLLPPELLAKATEPSYTGSTDIETFEEDDAWAFSFDIDAFREHFESFPHSKENPEAFAELWKEVDTLLEQGRKLDGVFPAKLILATRV